MSNISNEDFTNWYKSANPSPDANVVASRIEGIGKVLKFSKADFWLDLVRLFIGIPVKDTDNIDKFLDKFRSGDNAVPAENNENLIRCLAAITLCYKLETPDPNFNTLISLAIVNSNFLEQHQLYNTVPVVDLANKHLITSSIFERELKTEEIEDRLSELTKALKEEDAADKQIPAAKKAITALVEEIKTIVHANRTLAEESNVLWWVFGGYSELAELSYKEMEPVFAIVVAAKELAEITSYSQCIASANQILHRMVPMDAKGKGKSKVKGVSLFEVANTLPSGFAVKLFNDGSVINEFTPCLMAIRTSLPPTAKNEWSGIYSRQNFKGDVKKAFTLQEMAMQFYREFVYLKSLV